MEYKFGDKIKLILQDNEEITGMYVPSKDKCFIVIKLDSGYNMTIDKKNIKSTKLITANKQKKPVVTEIKQDDSLPLIYILHIGGTIASKVDYKTGGVSAQIESSELLNMIPELKKLARIETKVLFNILSGNVRFEHFNVIAKEILEILEHENIAGVIVSHGTDTMHYSSAGLSFILQNIKIPVVFVGSQRSSDRPSSDSILNVVSAAEFIVDQTKRKDSYTGVFASMHGSSNDTFCSIYSGFNLRKMHSSRRDTFRQINSLPIAKVENSKIEYLDLEESDEVLPLFEPAYFRTDIKIGIIRAHPNMFAEEISKYEDFDGLIIEGTGLGNMPVELDGKITNENKRILNALTQFTKKKPVVITTQCINGSTNLNVYSYGRTVKNAGILEAEATITETAFIKLAWLLSNFSYSEIKNEMWQRNFIGEKISRDLYEKNWCD
jgi:glutamyl-tRNA(Gln) amidotransferase subunit D